MNATEKKYAISRVDGIARNKRREIEDSTETESITITYKEKIKLLRQGKVKIRKRVDFFGEPTINEMFDFSEYEKGREIDTVKRTKLLALLNAEAYRIRDQVMLGDSKEALKLIEAFDAFGA